MRPLDGVKVLDFTRHLAGPYATLALSDYGADVVKVESLSGDPSRRTGVDHVGDESALFLICNRGKRSIALNLHQERAKEAVRRLVADADVLVENYRPGQAERIGIGYEQMAAVNSRLIYLSISAFGADGPLAPFAGTDPLVQAASGVMSVTGEPDCGPSLVGVPIADFTGAMLGVQAVLLGLIARQRTGRGQKIDVSMLYGLLSSLTTRLASYWATGKDPGRHGGSHSWAMPFEAFQTADGYAVAGAWSEDSWEPFCNVIGLPELAADPRYLTNDQRVAAREQLRAVISEELRRRTTEEWTQRFRDGGVPLGPVRSVSEILSHPQVTQAGILGTLEHPVIGAIPQLGPVIDLADTPGYMTTPPPMLGQHTCEVLSEAGYDDQQITSLIVDGLAGTSRPERLQPQTPSSDRSLA